MLLRVSVGRHSRYTTTSGTHSKCCNTLPTHSLAHTLSRSRILKFYFFFFYNFTHNFTRMFYPLTSIEFIECISPRIGLRGRASHVG